MQSSHNVKIFQDKVACSNLHAETKAMIEALRDSFSTLSPLQQRCFEGLLKYCDRCQLDIRLASDLFEQARNENKMKEAR